MQKHAYLIMAHNEFEILKKLLIELDYEWNDIYIHIDSKAGKIDYDEYKKCVKYSKVEFIERKSITWAGESQIECEIRLFEYAKKFKYKYYHLISGVDFPIKTQKRIHDFFEKNEGKEFIEFWDRPLKEYEYRVKYFYPLQEKIGRYTNDVKTLILRVISKMYVGVQFLCGKNRLNEMQGELKIGANWVSVTDEFVGFLLENKSDIINRFYQGVAADELFVQTLCWNSKFRDSISNQKTRLIDWDRGNPYTWQENDVEEIMKSPCLFVRKVTQNNCLVERIQERLCKEEKNER